MDVLAVTNFPDIRFKCMIQSATEGSLLIIPREGGYLVRNCVELDKLAANERVDGRNITQDQLIAATQRIMAPSRWTSKKCRGGQCMKSASVCAKDLTMLSLKKQPHVCHAFLSQATPATPTPPKPGRA